MQDYEEFRKRLSRNINSAMKRRGYSQIQLAAVSGITAGTLHGMISGKRDTHISALWSVAKALNVPPEELIGEMKYGKSEYQSEPKTPVRTRHRPVSVDDDAAVIAGIR